MLVNRSLLLLVAAIVCFLVALLIVTGAISGSSAEAWEVGGWLALAGSLLP